MFAQSASDQTKSPQVSRQFPSAENEATHRRDIAGWFYHQAGVTPGNIAITFENEAWTYARLNARSNQLAAFLQAEGVGPETLVGICCDRSVEMVVGILAVIKAGGAYVPFDLAYPSERLAFMFQDSGIKILLTQKNLAEQIPHSPESSSPAENPELRLLFLDEASTELSAFPETNLQTRIDPGHLAYVIYTSGSTGKPKGVLVTHENVVRLFSRTEDWYRFDASDVWTLFHSYAFDFSVWEIWGALLYGGRLVIVPFMVSRSPAAFLSLLSREKVTVLNQTPSAFRQLVWADQNEPQSLALRYVIFGGEALELQSLKPWFDRHGDQTPRLINMYGITETTVHVTYRPIFLRDVIAGSGSVIGGPIPDLEVFVLNESLEIVEQGADGEMYVGGAGVARGYLNRPELTAERFILSPLDGGKTRLYRTGDMARVLKDGDLEYLGRMDHQVKIRGFRIELGEIESVLNQHPSLRESTVTAHVFPDSEKALVAYVVSRGNERPTITDLREFLKTKLPDYMIPAVFVYLARLPLTTNGKVDRAAFPKPGRTRPELRAAFRPPNSGPEKTLCQIWSEVLDIQPVGMDDNFFELGGDSIRSLQILARAAESDISISVSDIFREQTIANLLSQVGTETWTGLDPDQKLEPFCLLSPQDREKVSPALEDAYSAVRLQTGMFYHGELHPESAVYHDVFSYRIEAPFQEKKIREALKILSQRHTILRTSFDLNLFSEPLQLVHSSVQIPYMVYDLRHESSEKQTEALIDCLDLEKARPFDWRTAPLLRFHFHIRSEHCFQLTYGSHHAILDGWSLAAMLTEILQIYSSLLDERPVEASVSVAYREYVALEKESLNSAADRHYWKQQIQGFTATRMPKWHGTEPMGKPGEVLVKPVPLSRSVSDSIRTLSSSLGVPLKSVLLAAHLKVLSFLNNQRDVTTGYVANGRPEKKHSDKTLGLFLNTLPFRCRLPAGSWRDLIRETFSTEQDLLAHRWFPLAEIQRETGGNDLFETSFDMVHFHVYEAVLQKESIAFCEERFFESTNFTFFAFFQIDPVTSQVTLRFDVDASRFCDPQLAALAGYYQKVLEEMTLRPASKHDDLQLLSGEEYQRIVRDWNVTDHLAVPDLCIHNLFEQQSGRLPQKTAVRIGSNSLGYRELNERSNQLAHFLRSQGAGSGSMVGICLNRSPEMVVAILGVLKAGCAYVPLDPEYPVDRLDFMVRDASIHLVVANGNRVTFAASETVLDLSVSSSELAQQPTTNPEIPLTDTDLAYVIYTSGSTGNPKGVLVSHGNLMHSTVARFLYYREPVESFLLLSSYAFDSSVAGIFWTLSQGGTLCLPEAALTDSDAIVRALQENQASHLLALPSLYSLILETNASLESLKTVIVAGEICPVELVAKHALRLPGVALFNEYGPTEGTVWSLVFRCDADRDQAVVPIGKPIPGVQVYILNDQLQPVPAGVEGELFIGGRGVAAGYLNRPELTQAKFLPNPFDSSKAGKLYRTGDKGRYLPDGNIEFLGRVDFQVKIRGYRIELQEIESLLLRHPAVVEAAVIAREDRPGNKALAAYVVLREPVSVEDLQNHLGSKLPRWMVPPSIMLLDAFPKTANGKLDRGALPAPDHGARTVVAYAAPETDAERDLVRIWEDVLARKPMGVNDNFFANGGHSLLAMQAISRIRQKFESHIALKRLFEHPTPRLFARQVESVEGDSLEHPDISPADRSKFLPASFSQEALWFLHKLHPDIASYNLPFAIRLEHCAVDTETVRRAVLSVVHRHESLRTTFEECTEGVRQVIQKPGGIDFDLLNFAPIPESSRQEAISRWIEGEISSPFDLVRGPLLRVRLLITSHEEKILFLNFHHIITDGVSIGILFREISALLCGELTGKPASFTASGLEFADYAVWQRKNLQGKHLENLVQFWRSKLAGAPELLELPTDHPRPVMQTFGGCCENLTLTGSLVERFEQVTKENGATLFMGALALFQVLLHRHASQEDVVVGCPVANRTKIETESIVGLFANVIPMRSQLKPGETFQSFLKRVAANALECYAHEGLPFEKLVEELRLERNLSFNPVFQAAFAFHQAPVPVRQDDMIIAPWEVDSVTAKFDLSLYFIAENGSYRLRMEFNSDLFERATIERFLKRFEVLMGSVCRDVRTEIHNLEMIPDEEVNELFHTLNATNRSYDLNKGVVALFCDQARLRPEAMAVSDAAASVSYGGLDEKSNRVAASLEARGIRKGELVAVRMERSVDFVISILGILKAGAAYLPVDFETPMERLRLMLARSKAVLLISGPGRFTEVHVEFPVPVVQVNELVAFNNGIEPCQSSGEDLAYVIFTSGSTGEPKGVAIPHRGLSNLILWHLETYKVLADDRASQLANLAFDAAVWEIWPYLATGASVHFPPESHRSDPRLLAQWLQEEKISISFMPTPLAEAFLNEPASASNALRFLLTGGDKLQKVPGRELPFTLVNHYGPTENSVVSTFAFIRCGISDQSPPIGRPISNVRAYVLDDHQRVVPFGTAGELLLGGGGLALGYVGDSVLTAEKFVQVQGLPEKRLYRTGDTVRYRNDGSLQFLGRRDNQVKIRGFRIETGEIEVILANHPGLGGAVVQVKKGQNDIPQLVAYAVPRPGVTLTGALLTEFLAKHLPGYMIPGHFVFLEEFPLTTNGKIDRKALPEPSGETSGSLFVAPGSPTEKRLETIWSSVLKLDRIGVTDNFFTLGGHSLLATQVVSRIRDAFEIVIPLRRLFERPTIAGLAAIIEESAGFKPAQHTGSPPELHAELLAQLEGLSPEQLEVLLGKPG